MISAAEQNQTSEQFQNLLQKSSDSSRTDFPIRLTTNHFSPRAKIGQVLVMYIGAIAEDGDIVSLGSGDSPQYQVAWYLDGMEYYAVCGAIMSARTELVGGAL